MKIKIETNSPDMLKIDVEPKDHSGLVTFLIVVVLTAAACSSLLILLAAIKAPLLGKVGIQHLHNSSVVLLGRVLIPILMLLTIYIATRQRIIKALTLTPNEIEIIRKMTRFSMVIPTQNITSATVIKSRWRSLYLLYLADGKKARIDASSELSDLLKDEFPKRYAFPVTFRNSLF